MSFGDDGAALTVTCEPAHIEEFRGMLVADESGIVMQSTGLKDKNGVEIFEGDIIQFLYADEPRQEPIAKVEWDPESACFALRTVDEHEEAEACLYESRALVSKVIGNIYEHPRLLNAA